MYEVIYATFFHPIRNSVHASSNQCDVSVIYCLVICLCPDHDVFLLLQFSNLDAMEKHGFARNRVWAVDNCPLLFPSSSDDKAVVDLILRPTEEDLKSWNHGYPFWKV